METLHYQRVKSFMKKAKQGTPAWPAVPDERTRILRARLILEEALETAEALGVQVSVQGHLVGEDGQLSFTAHPTKKPDLVGIADGCADVSVVTTGTLVACGIPDHELLNLVDENNLAKFGPGHSFREDGKLIKPPHHRPPNITGLLQRLCEEVMEERP